MAKTLLSTSAISHICFNDKLSLLTFLNTFYGIVEPTPGRCEYTHELSQLLVLGLPRLDCMGTFDCYLFHYGLVTSFVASLAAVFLEHL